MTAVTFKEDMEWGGSHRAQGEAVNMELDEAKALAKQGKVNVFQPMTEINESHPVDPSKMLASESDAAQTVRNQVNQERNAVQTTEEPETPGVDTTQEQKGVDASPVDKQVKGAPEKK